MIDAIMDLDINPFGDTNLSDYFIEGSGNYVCYLYLILYIRYYETLSLQMGIDLFPKRNKIFINDFELTHRISKVEFMKLADETNRILFKKAVVLSNWEIKMFSVADFKNELIELHIKLSKNKFDKDRTAFISKYSDEENILINLSELFDDAITLSKVSEIGVMYHKKLGTYMEWRKKQKTIAKFIKNYDSKLCLLLQKIVNPFSNHFRLVSNHGIFSGNYVFGFYREFPIKDYRKLNMDFCLNIFYLEIILEKLMKIIERRSDD